MAVVCSQGLVLPVLRRAVLPVPVPVLRREVLSVELGLWMRWPVRGVVEQLRLLGRVVECLVCLCWLRHLMPYVWDLSGVDLFV